jgi:hypothetical protein
MMKRRQVRPLTEHEKEMYARTQDFVRQSAPHLNAEQRRVVVGKIFRELKRAWSSYKRRVMNRE